MSASKEKHEQTDTGVRPYRFGRPGMLREEEMDALRRANRNLPAQIRRGTDGFLRGGLPVELSGFEQGDWDAGLEAIDGDPVGCRFVTAPHGHRGMVVTSRSFAGACVGRALGQGADGEPDRELTTLEARLFSRLVQRLVGVLPRAWRGMGDFEVEVEKYLSDPRGEAPLRPDQNYVHFLFDARCGADEGEMALSFPSLPLRGLATPRSEDDSADEAGDAETAQANLRRTPVQLKAVLGRAELTPDELMDLEEGDLVMLDTTPEDLLDVEVEQAGKLLGTPARRKGRRAVKIECKAEDSRDAGS